MKTFVFLGLAILVSACGGKSRDDLGCGPGTTAVDGLCVPVDGGTDSDSSTSSDSGSDADSDSDTTSATESESDTTTETGSETGSDDPCPAGEDWITESVGDDERTERDPVLAIWGAGDEPHAAFGWVDAPGVEHAWRDEGVWSQEEVDPSIASTAMGLVASPDELYLVFSDATDPSPLYLGSIVPGGDWSVDEIASLRTSGASVFVGGDGVVHVAYRETALIGNHTVYYGNNASGDWTFEPAISCLGCTWTGVVVESTGTAHVVTDSFDGLQHATNASGDWVQEILDPDARANRPPSIAVDGSDTVHITYTSSFDGTYWIFHGTYDAGVWNTENAVQGGLDSVASPVVVDASDQVHICYRRNDDSVRYATLSGGAWSSEILLDDSGASWTTCDIALGSDDLPWVVFDDQTGRGADGLGGELILMHRCR